MTTLVQSLRKEQLKPSETDSHKRIVVHFTGAQGPGAKDDDPGAADQRHAAPSRPQERRASAGTATGAAAAAKLPSTGAGG